MGTVTKFTVCSTASIAMFNMYLDTNTSFGITEEKKNENSNAILSLAKGLFNKVGLAVQQANAKDWRERLLENIPYKIEDTCFVNLPERFDPASFRKRNVTQEEINTALDDADGSMFIYATFLKPGRHQIIIKD